jgi:HK97 family phage prohead protease
MSDLLEHRSLVEAPEFRSKGNTLTAAGVAMRYGARSKPIAGKFRETFTSGAFSKTLAGGGDIHSHNEHHGPYLGRTSNGTLRLTDTRSELSYEIDLPDTTAGRDAAALLERGDIKGSSIGFIATPKGSAWTVGTDGLAFRTVSAAELYVVDLTVAPAYDDSTAEMAMRSLAYETGSDLRSLIEAAASGGLAGVVGGPLSPDELKLRRWVRAEVGGSRRSAVVPAHRRPAHWFV